MTAPSEADGLGPLDEERSPGGGNPGLYALTFTEAGYLADLIRAVETGAKIEWYPSGASGGAPSADYVLRCFAHDGGGLWFDKDGDVRDSYVHMSGVVERWIKVADVMRALANASCARYGYDSPMAFIRWPAPSVRAAEVDAAFTVLDRQLGELPGKPRIDEIRQLAGNILQAAVKARS